MSRHACFPSLLTICISRPLTYTRAFQRCLDRLSLTLIQTYRDLTLGADFIDRSTHSLLRILTSPGVRDTRHAHAVLEHLLFSDKLSTKQIKSIKSSTLHALKAGGQVGGGRVATLHRLNLLVITSYLLRVGNPATQVGQEDELYKTMERLSSMFEPLRVCNSLEADVLSHTLATFLVDFFPPSHLLNKCLGEFLSSQQQHCKYLARMLFAIFSRFQTDVHHYGTDTSQEWIVLSLSSFTQLVPITLGLWALTCFLVCGAQNHWIRASFPFFQSRFGQFSEEDKDTFFTICYHVFMEVSFGNESQPLSTNQVCLHLDQIGCEQENICENIPESSFHSLCQSRQWLEHTPNLDFLSIL